MSEAVLPLDALGVGAVSVFVMMTGVWALAFVKRDASVVDVFWGPGFAIAVLAYTLVTQGDATRAMLVTALVWAWAARLAIHIGARSRGEPEDARYRAMRARDPEGFPYKSLVTVFWLQAALLVVLSLPLLAAVAAETPRGLTPFDYAGAALFLFGLAFEAVADAQLQRHREDRKSAGEVLDRGLWRYSRHPNYFGECVVWWGTFIVALGVPGGYWTLPAPVLMTFLLLRVSGVSLLEDHMRETKPKYADYVRRTSAFLPLPPRDPSR